MLAEQKIGDNARCWQFQHADDANASSVHTPQAANHKREWYGHADDSYQRDQHKMIRRPRFSGNGPGRLYTEPEDAGNDSSITGRSHRWKIVAYPASA